MLIKPYIHFQKHAHTNVFEDFWGYIQPTNVRILENVMKFLEVSTSIDSFFVHLLAMVHPRTELGNINLSKTSQSSQDRVATRDYQKRIFSILYMI